MIGKKLAHYEITAHLGSGGFGDVYQATDTKLGRSVAIKLLPEAFAYDAERVARFEREARLLASLNHPNIAAIYGIEESDGRKFLVMELVGGETLAELIKRGPIPIDESLRITKYIAEAAETAHENGVIHRDLKPTNIKIAPDGTVKVLDFGLAKAFAIDGGSPLPGGEGFSQSPTLSMAATNAGVILGTAAYMSPEQAAGKPVDKRADVWSLGVILWEMLTGQRLFDGETVSHTLADVLRAEIDFNKLPSNTPPAIRDLLRRCLDRDTKNRLRDIGEARVVIQKYLANPSAASAALHSGVTGRSSRLAAAAWGVAVVAVMGAAALAFVHFRERPAIPGIVRFQVMPPDETTFGTTAVLSPDGRRLAFEAPGPDGRPILFVRSLDALEARALPGTEGVSPGPFCPPTAGFWPSA